MGRIDAVPATRITVTARSVGQSYRLQASEYPSVTVPLDEHLERTIAIRRCREELGYQKG
jgi:hypothetical protein